MPFEFRMRRVVEFAETDMAGIMHFSNFFRYMEATEHNFVRSLGHTLHHNTDGVMHGWARVQAECKYLRPAHYADELELELLVREKSKRSIQYEVFFHRLPSTQNPSVELLAHGKMTVVCVERAPGDTQIKAAAMPNDLFDKIEIAPSDRFEKERDHA